MLAVRTCVWSVLLLALHIVADRFVPKILRPKILCYYRSEKRCSLSQQSPRIQPSLLCFIMLRIVFSVCSEPRKANPSVPVLFCCGFGSLRRSFLCFLGKCSFAQKDGNLVLEQPASLGALPVPLLPPHAIFLCFMSLVSGFVILEVCFRFF